MDIFSKNKFLTRLVVVLILLNVVSIGFQWWDKLDNNGRPPKPEINKLTAILTKELQLTPIQAESLKKIRVEFFEKEEILQQQVRVRRDSMNRLMFNEQTDTLLVKNIARRIAEYEYLTQMCRLEQAQQLKSICTKEQLKKLDELVIEMRDYFQSRQRNKPPPPDK